MNLKRNTVLASAVAVALGLGSGSALAAGTIIAGSLTFAQEITATATNPAWLNMGWGNPQGQLGFGVSAGQSVYLRFNLSGDGAKFSAVSPALTVSGSTGFVPGTLVSGGAGAGFAIFQVTAPISGFTQTQPYGLSVSGGTVTGTTNPVMISYAEYANAPDASNQTGALASASTTLLSFAQTLDAVGQAGTALKIDVASNNTKFVGGATVSPIGEVAIGALTGRLRPTGGSITNYANLASTGTFTVTGNFAAAPIPSDVYLSANSSCSGAIATASTLSATQAMFNLGVTALGTFNGTGASGYAYLCYKVSGTTPIAFGVTYTATYTPTANSGYTLPGSFPMTLGTLTTNGVTATVLNIPSATNTDQPYIRIYNTSSLAGPIRGTLYAQDGTVLYNGVLIPSLAAHAVKILTAQDLETLAGTTWTGRAYMQVFGQVPGMDVQLLIRDANGTLVNVSSKAPKQ